ncbi:hypothetical protein [Gottfriedia acidiceleris]
MKNEFELPITIERLLKFLTTNGEKYQISETFIKRYRTSLQVLYPKLED